MPIPTISVILPTRNRPEYLPAAVQSVFAQQVVPSELLVIDDAPGSHAFETLRALSSHAKIPTRLLPGPQAGPAAARNVGLREATGELAAFLDDDDLWLPQKLEWQVHWLDRRPELGLLGTDCLRTPEPARHPAAVSRMPARVRSISLGALLRRNHLAMSGVVVRRECFEHCGGFDESLALAQDWDMWLRIATRWQVGIVSAPLTIHRLHHRQRSADRRAMRRFEMEVLARAMDRGDLDRGRLRGIARRRLAWSHCRLARLLAREGERDSALRELQQALAIIPYHPTVWSTLTRCALPRRAAARARQI